MKDALIQIYLVGCSGLTTDKPSDTVVTQGQMTYISCVIGRVYLGDISIYNSRYRVDKC
jgi:hypothetical protein